MGRLDDLKALEALLRAGERVVNLVAPAGMGKTCLAMHLAHTLERRDDIGWRSLFVGLDTATRLAEVCTRVGLALEAAGGKTSSPVDAVGYALRARGPLLVILDNAEQAAEDVGVAVARWVALAPDARFVVTSRAAVGLACEHVYPLRPLHVPAPSGLGADQLLQYEAVELLLSRASDFRISDANAAAVAELVCGLEGIPLAIELTAARLEIMSPDQLHARRDQLLDILGRSSAATHKRHTTLRGALEKSLQSLREREAQVFACCSVFRGGFSLDALESVLDNVPETALDAGPAIEGIQALVAKSLVRLHKLDEGASMRFSLFHYIRVYADEVLADSGADAETKQRHAAYYARESSDRLDNLCSAQAGAATRWLLAELDNLLAALAWVATRIGADPRTTEARLVLAADSVLALRGPLETRIRVLNRVIDAPGFADCPAPLAAQVLLARARARKQDGQMQAASHDRMRAQTSCTPMRGPLAADILTEGGLIHQAQGELREARICFDQAHEALEVAAPPAHASPTGARLLVGQGLLSHCQGHLTEAALHYETARCVARRAWDFISERAALVQLGGLRQQQKRFTEARDLYRRALEVQPTLVDPAQPGIIECNRGILEHEQGEFDDARDHIERALGIFRRCGDRLLEGQALGYLGLVHHEHVEHDRATKHYRDAIDIVREFGDRRNEALFLAALGGAQSAQDQTSAAIESFAQSGRALAPLGDAGISLATGLHRGHLDLALARQSLARGEAEAASTYHRQAVLRVSTAADNSSPCLNSSDDARIAARILRSALDVLAWDYDWDAAVLRSPAAVAIDLSTRGPLRRIVEALFDQHRLRPGDELATDALVEAGWPGVRASVPAQANRFKVALSTLRKLGLRNLLQRKENGYRIDPGAYLVVRNRTSPPQAQQAPQG